MGVGGGLGLDGGTSVSESTLTAGTEGGGVLALDKDISLDTK